ncbi:MAG: 1-(5-phosphoribosyl)-5-[(5-phosphoribosylamino)methylideneamino]imidazole-4-carboxamide isomerase [SAR324 cluster bacterium]|nr:1-(5-phosphoribosyl)-5-[(5-phosphoribosylamino)methylideneamino]imidazole-4-carboxamide isomerase [SAR324 cluster bacterium]
MLILPAIDLKDGKCVRLTQGRSEAVTVYSGNPAGVALDFVRAGAKMLHLVDLDGAFGGQVGNLASIAAIRAAVDIPLELGGGLRSLDNIANALGLGIDSVIIGTLAVRDPEMLERALHRFGNARVQLGIDAMEGQVAIAGWAEETRLDAVEFARQWRRRGIERVVFTDIARDGMLGGPNLAAIRRFARESGVRVTASGGVTDKADIRSIAALEPDGVDRVIVGKAFYEGRLRLEDVAEFNH